MCEGRRWCDTWVERERVAVCASVYNFRNKTKCADADLMTFMSQWSPYYNILVGNSRQ